MKANEIGNKMKAWGNSHPKTKRFCKATLEVIAKGLTAGMQKPEPPQVKDGEVLDAKQVKALSGMTSWQLNSIFAGKKVTFATDPETLMAIHELTSWQINAILQNKD